jgi:chemotaxis protein MotB
MARKRQAPEEHENHERWLVSYADFITLLFAFFVVMYAVSSVNEGKYRVLSESLVAAFRSPNKSLEPIQIGAVVKYPYAMSPGMPNTPKAIVPVAIPPVKPKPPFDLPMRFERRKRKLVRVAAPLLAPVQQAVRITESPVCGAQPAVGTKDGGFGSVMQEMARQIEQAMAGLIERDLIAVRRNVLWLEVEIKNSILFPSGSAAIESSAMPVLQKLAEILHRFPNPIQVEGFTDNIPIRNVAYPSNWELSAGRAASVVHLFTDLGIAPERMAAVGYGEHRPRADNSTPEGRQQNRRVVLVVLANPGIQRMLAIGRPALTEPGPDRADPAAARQQPNRAHEQPQAMEVGAHLVHEAWGNEQPAGSWGMSRHDR